MKLAIISVTSNGARLGESLAKMLPEQYQYILYEKNGRQSGSGNGQTLYYDTLKPMLEVIWSNYEGFVFIMAVGIVVRDIANLIKHKSVDPAVLVMDELGLHCISLLSGHIGGANDLTRLVARIVGANPVITTASDINGMVVPDAVSKSLNLEIESYSVLKKINGSIVAREQVDFYVDSALPEVHTFIKRTEGMGLSFKIWQNGVDLQYAKSIVYVSEKQKELPFETVLYLRPKSIIVGIGCKRGMSAEKLEYALEQSLKESGYNRKCVKALVSAWIKIDEEGLQILAKKLKVPIFFYEKKCLQESIEQNRLLKSDFVQKEIGVGNVCEAAALAHSQQAHLVQTKKNYNGITVALARESFLS